MPRAADPYLGMAFAPADRASRAIGARDIPVSEPVVEMPFDLLRSVADARMLRISDLTSDPSAPMSGQRERTSNTRTRTPRLRAREDGLRRDPNDRMEKTMPALQIPDLRSLRGLDESVEALRDIERQIVALEDAHKGEAFGETERETFAALVESRTALTAHIEEMRVRTAMIERIAREHPEAVEHTDPEPPTRVRRDALRQETDVALRVLERNRDAFSADAGRRIERLVRERDPLGLASRWIGAAGDPAYTSAFGKIVRDPVHGHLGHTPVEVEAMRRAAAVMAERALSEGTGSLGGFALPIVIDPTVLLTSSGALNPVRQMARTITIASREWRGVSSDGVVATYEAEETEAADAAPTPLVQPTIVCEMGRAFVPFSIEVGQDWDGLQAELARLIADARDVLDATKFLSGTGTNEPTGILTGLSASQRVQTALADTFAVGDVYLLKQAIPPRFVSNTRFVASSVVWDATYRLVPSGSTTEPQLMTSRDAPLLGRPRAEWSAMSTATTTTGEKIMLAGDFFAGYTIADRIGMTVELVPHLFGANRRPTGQRGLYAFWRTGADVVNPAALRYLEVL